MIQLSMTPQQFAAAKAAIESSDQVVSHSESGPQSGSFATGAVGFSYSYDGATLSLSITAKHGLAAFASENTIKDRLVILLGKMQAV